MLHSKQPAHAAQQTAVITCDTDPVWYQWQYDPPVKRFRHLHSCLLAQQHCKAQHTPDIRQLTAQRRNHSTCSVRTLTTARPASPSALPIRWLPPMADTHGRPWQTPRPTPPPNSMHTNTRDTNTQADTNLPHMATAYSVSHGGQALWPRVLVCCRVWAPQLQTPHLSHACCARTNTQYQQYQATAAGRLLGLTNNLLPPPHLVGGHIVAGALPQERLQPQAHIRLHCSLLLLSNATIKPLLHHGTCYTLYRANEPHCSKLTGYQT
jgi:hypothetical protein